MTENLKHRIETVENGSRDLDEAIYDTLFPDDSWWQCILKGRRLCAEGTYDERIVDARGNSMTADAWAFGCKVTGYTSSVDAALALVERALPGWRLHLSARWGQNDWYALLSGGQTRDAPPGVWNSSNSRPRHSLRPHVRPPHSDKGIGKSMGQANPLFLRTLVLSLEPKSALTTLMEYCSR
jgi:hypothetical protein